MEEYCNLVNKEMEHMCSHVSSDDPPGPLFKVITCINFGGEQELPSINFVEIHKGKDPSVEIICFQGEKVSGQDEPPAQSIKLMFTGDMERQNFISAIIAVSDPVEEDDSHHHEVKHEETKRDDDDSEEEELPEDDISFESHIDAIIYN